MSQVSIIGNGLRERFECLHASVDYFLNVTMFVVDETKKCLERKSFNVYMLPLT
mgnify:CR=1 FL=1